MTLSTAVVLLTALGLPGAPRHRAAPPPAQPRPQSQPQPHPQPPPPKAQQTVLVMPVMARHGASQGTGTALGQLIQSSMTELPGYDVSGYDSMAYGLKDPVVPSLARCPDLNCAVELGRRLNFDQVIVGTLDGTNGDPRLVMWRVAVQDGSVLGIYENTLDEPALDALSRAPEVVVAALMRPGALQRPLEPVTVPAVAPAAAPPPAPAPAVALALPPPLPPTAQERACTPARVDAAATVAPWKGWLRMAGAAALGAAGAAGVATLGVLAGYTGLIIYDVTRVNRTGVHPFTRGFSFAVDLTALSAGGLGVVVATPVALLGLTALVLSWLVPTL